MSQKTKKQFSYSLKPWTEHEEIMLFCMRQDGITYRIIASELYRSVNSCEKKYRTTNWTIKSYYDPVKGKIYERHKKAYLERLTQLQDKRLTIGHYKADIIADKLVQAVDALPKVSKTVYKKKKSKTKNKTHTHTEDVGLILSDAHIGHTHTFEETGGLSEYNLDVFKQRVNNLKYATSDIVELHSHLYKLPTLHIFCLGDMVAGMADVGAWSPSYITMPIFEQFIQGVDSLSEMIYYWLGLFENIKFYGVYGNHGRVNKKGVEKEYVNWDYLCYQFLMKSFSNNSRIEFIVPKTWWIFETICDHKFLMVHGDDLRGQSWPARSLLDCEQKMMGIIRDIPDYTLAGHYHSAAELTTNHGRVMLNGCFLPETRVHLSNGIMVPISEVCIGDSVIGQDLRPSIVSGKIRKKHNGELVCFRTVGNTRSIKTTPNHEFLAVKASKIFDIPKKVTESSKYNPIKNKDKIRKIQPEFARAEFLSKGDYLAISCDKSLDVKADTTIDIDINGRNLTVNSDVAKLIGLYLAEGSTSGEKGKNYHSTWSFHIKEKMFANFVADILKKNFHLKPRITERKKKTLCEVVVNNKEFGDWIVGFCGKGCKNKELPGAIMKWPICLQKDILVGYLAGDGHLSQVTRNGGICYMAATVSEKLRDQLFYISRNIGYNSRIREQAVGGRRKNITYWIFFNGYDAIELDSIFVKEFNCAYRGSSIRNFIDCGKYRLVKISQCWTEKYKGDVFDLEVLEQESYNVEGVICHNSFIGGDIYSLKMLQKSSKPEQKIFGIHNKRGITWTYNLNLDLDRR